MIIDMYRNHDHNRHSTDKVCIPSPPMPSKTMSKMPSGPTASRIVAWYADAASGGLRWV